MTRVRRGFKARRRRNKVLKMAKGFNFDRRNKFRRTVETVRRALAFSYAGRKRLKRDMRMLWIVRIGAASTALGTSYSKFMGSLKKKGLLINRKMLAEMAAYDFDGFKALFNSVK